MRVRYQRRYQHQLLLLAPAVAAVSSLLEGLGARWVGTAPYSSGLCDRRRSLGHKPAAFATAI